MIWILIWVTCIFYIINKFKNIVLVYFSIIIYILYTCVTFLPGSFCSSYLLLLFNVSAFDLHQGSNNCFKRGSFFWVGVPTVLHQFQKFFRCIDQIRCRHFRPFTTQHGLHDMMGKGIPRIRPRYTARDQFVHDHPKRIDIGREPVIVAHDFRCHPC